MGSLVFQGIIETICEQIAAHLPRRIITRGQNEPYLDRYYLRRHSERWPLLPGVYLHHFITGDNEDELHNHPCAISISLVLTGGYDEERRVGSSPILRKRRIKPGHLNVIRGDDFHKIRLLDPTRGAWTIFIAGKRVQVWGFWHPITQVFTPWVGDGNPGVDLAHGD